MTKYEQKALAELKKWQQLMKKKPTIFDTFSKRTQAKINSYIPEKVHKMLTVAIKQMVETVLFGAELLTFDEYKFSSFEASEMVILEKIKFYKKTAAVEGGITGAGGILMGLADFPLLFTLKMKLLFDIANVYGLDVKDYRERLYLLYIFQLAFSSPEHRQKVYHYIQHWDEKYKDLPTDVHEFDWKSFQQEYRDYIDLAKLGQLLPIIGAPVGAVVNYRLIEKLGVTAMNAYRMRLLL